MKTITFLRKTAALVVVFAFVSSQVAYPRQLGPLNLYEDRTLASGVSAKQAVAADQTAASVVDMQTALLTPAVQQMYMSASNPAEQQVAAPQPNVILATIDPDPSTGILTLPNGQQIDLHAYPNSAGAQLTIEYYASGRVKKITNPLEVSGWWVNSQGYVWWYEYGRTSKVYSFTDEAYYDTSIGSMGRMTEERIDDSMHIGNGHPVTTYTYWDATDTVKIKSTIDVNLILGTCPWETVEYDVNGNVVRTTQYFYPTGGQVGSGRYIHSKGLSAPDEQGYVYYEYYNDDFSRDQWNNSIGRVKLARRADGSYDTFDSYYPNSAQAQTVSLYNSSGQFVGKKIYNASGVLIQKDTYGRLELYLYLLNRTEYAESGALWRVTDYSYGRISSAYTRYGTVASTYYADGRLESTAVTQYSSNWGYQFENYYTSYLDEDWNGQGYGRVTKVVRKLTDIHGANTYEYEYYANSTDVKTVASYRSNGVLIAKVTYDEQGRIIADPATGLLTLPNGLRIDLHAYPNSANAQITIEYYDSGRIKRITNPVEVSGWWVNSQGHVWWYEYGRTSFVYNFADEDFYDTSLGMMGRMTGDKVQDSAHMGNDYRDITYTYWNSTDNIKVRTTVNRNMILGDYLSEVTEYNAGGTIAQKTSYFFATGGPAGSSGRWLVNKTLANPDAQGYVYYEYYKDDYSRDQFNASIGHVKKAVRADGSYIVYNEYYPNSGQAKVISSYGSNGNLLTKVTYNASGAVTRTQTGINGVWDLLLMAQNPGGDYLLAGNIDASATSTLNGGAGWNPIANFLGTLDGQGFSISNLYIYRPLQNNVGLFACNSGVITGVSLVAAVVNGFNNVGALAGFNSGLITSSSTSGYVGNNAKGYSACLGGLVGANTGWISNSSSLVNVWFGSGCLGGLAGWNNGLITGSFAYGSVSGWNYAGGLVGYNEKSGRIYNSGATGTVTGSLCTGGAVGFNLGLIQDSWARGRVNGGSYAGGLVGYNIGMIYRGFAMGSVYGKYWVGKFVGYNDGKIIW